MFASRRQLFAAILGCTGCGAAAIHPAGTSVHQNASTLQGYDCSAGVGSSTIPSDGHFYLTSFAEGGPLACNGNPADGQSLYAADSQKFGCGAHLRITNPANGKSCVVKVEDYGPNICVEEAAGRPIIDASPMVAQALFGVGAAGWSEQLDIDVSTTSDPVGCGAPSGPACGSDNDCNSGNGGTGRVCSSSSGTCIWGCHSNFDCHSDQVCDVANTFSCKAKPAAPCKSDTDCNHGQSGTGRVCGQYGACIWACHDSYACHSWQFCDTSLSTYACAGNGCSKDSDCTGGKNGQGVVCSNGGACSWGCHTNSDCPSGRSCNKSGASWTCQ